MKKVIHFTPVRKQSEIVNLHLNSLRNLKCIDFDLSLTFFDDNVEKKSSEILKNFISKQENSKLWDINLSMSPVKSTESRWDGSAYKRITEIKDFILFEFLKTDAEFLFLTDADLVLHPDTLKHMLDQKKDFISTIFWTHFEGRPTYFPNAWMSNSKIFKNKEDFLSLKENKIVPVDYTGACTLLSRKIIAEGVKFKKIPQVNAFGEDKHFCIRAGVLGFQPFLTTYYPAFHIYSNDLIEQAKRWIENDYNYDYLDTWLNDEWSNKISKYYNHSNSLIQKFKNSIKKITDNENRF